MGSQAQTNYTFSISNFPENVFSVGKFMGQEGLSRLYHFDVTLFSSDPDVDLNAVMKNRATLSIFTEEYGIVFHGIVSNMVQQQAYKNRYIYHAVLVPRLWRLTLTRHNQVFLDKSIPEIIKSVLQESGLSANDYEFRLQGRYPAKEYICQYQETHFDFISRWMEHVGIYYFFEQSESGEKCVITDINMSHVETPQNAKFRYAPPSGMESTHWNEAVQSFFCHQTLIPESVLLKDYNYRTPSLEISGQAEVDSEKGLGQDYVYGDHFSTPDEGHRMAHIRAEGYRCREKQFMGEGRIALVRPGYLFHLEDHFREDYNQSYLCVEVSHQGHHNVYLLDGMEVISKGTRQLPPYTNTFTAIPATTQYRPEIKTPKSRFHGVISAKIDAPDSGEYAELDDQGRYKIVLPFDLGGHEPGHCSAWLRMAQPYVGSSFGMHFPLHKGTEVLLSFVDGDPDRPIISAAVPNPDTPSVVRSENKTMAQIISSGQNKIHIEDKPGSERIMLHTPKGNNTWFRLGAPNDPPVYFHPKKGTYSESGAALSSEGPFAMLIGAAKTETVAGAVGDFFGGVKLEVAASGSVTLAFGTTMEYGKTVELKFHKGLKFLQVETSLEDRVEQIEHIRDVTAVRDHLRQVVGDYNQMTRNINSVTRNVRALEGQNQTATRDRRAINQRLNTIVGEVHGAYKTKINSTVTVVNSIRTELKKIGTKVQNVKSGNDNFETKIEKINNQIKKSTNSISSTNLTIIN